MPFLPPNQQRQSTEGNCPKTFNKTVTWYIFYHTSKILQTRKLGKSIFSMLFLKTFKDAKFTVHGSAFQTFITLSTKKLLSNASCAQCRINHVADVANATGLRPQGGSGSRESFFQPVSSQVI